MKTLHPTVRLAHLGREPQIKLLHPIKETNNAPNMGLIRPAGSAAPFTAQQHRQLLPYIFGGIGGGLSIQANYPFKKCRAKSQLLSYNCV